MAVELPVLSKTFEAAADLSTKQYHFVELDSNGRVAACNAATDLPIGVLQNKPSVLGMAAEVMITGITKVVADAALSIGNLIGTSADGQADAKTVGTDITEYVVGRMLSATGAAAEIGTATINCLNPHRAV